MREYKPLLIKSDVLWYLPWQHLSLGVQGNRCVPVPVPVFLLQEGGAVYYGILICF